MEIGLGVLGKIKVDDHIHSLNIDTAGKEIRAHQVAAATFRAGSAEDFDDLRDFLSELEAI